MGRTKINTEISMKFDVRTNSNPTQVLLTIGVSAPKTVRVLAYDRDFPKTILYDRTAPNPGEDTILIKMPLTGKAVSINIYNNSLGDPIDDTGIKILSKKVSKLKRELSESQIYDRYFREFVKFAEQFAFNAQYLDTGKTYQSSNKHFAIKYVDVITSASGAPMTTPARIKEDSGYMEFSKSRLAGFTVPGIMGIELHEFSHNFLNQDANNEEEADLNGLITYLGLGFPLVEAYKAWDNIYQYTKTDMNKARTSKVSQLLLEYAKELPYAA